MLLKGVHDALGLPVAQQAVVHKDAVQPFAEALQGRKERGRISPVTSRSS